MNPRMDIHQGKPHDFKVRDIAWWDPVEALGILLDIPRVPINLLCTATFVDDVDIQNRPPITAVSEPVHQRTWIDRVEYSLTTPNFLNNMPITNMIRACLKQQPGLNARVSVEPDPRYVVANIATPLENIGQIMKNPSWPAGWLLFKTQFIRMEYVLTQAPFAIDPGLPDEEIPPSPYIVTTTYWGWQFLDPTINKISRASAARELLARGVQTARAA